MIVKTISGANLEYDCKNKSVGQIEYMIVKNSVGQI